MKEVPLFILISIGTGLIGAAIGGFFGLISYGEANGNNNKVKNAEIRGLLIGSEIGSLIGIVSPSIIIGLLLLLNN